MTSRSVYFVEGIEVYDSELTIFQDTIQGNSVHVRYGVKVAFLARSMCFDDEYNCSVIKVRDVEGIHPSFIH